MNKINSDELFDQPMEVTSIGGAVVVLGPDAVAIAFTPGAAEASADLLREAAARARESRDPEPPTLPIDQV